MYAMSMQEIDLVSGGSFVSVGDLGGSWVGDLATAWNIGNSIGSFLYNNTDTAYWNAVGDNLLALG
jgi:hypothetical protein